MNPRLARVRSLREVGRYQEAIKEANLARAEDPNDATIAGLIGWCYHDLGDYIQAYHFAHEALKLEPDYIWALHLLGSSARVLGKIKESDWAIDRALALNPQNSHSHYMFAWKYQVSGDYKNALLAIDEALKLQPHNHMYLKIRGEILAKLGRRAEAKQATLESLRIEPEEASSIARLGAIERQEGNIAQSIQTLRSALRANPNDRTARQELRIAIRSRFFLHRWLLQISESLGRYTGRIAGISGYLIFAVVRVVMTAKNVPIAVKIVVGGILGLIVLFLLALLFTTVFVDAAATFDPELNLTLTRHQRVYSRLCAGLALGAMATTLLAVFRPLDWLILVAVMLWLVFFVIGLMYSKEQNRVR